MIGAHAYAPLAEDGLAAFIGSLPGHRVRVVAGLGADALAEHLAASPTPARPVLLFDLQAADNAAAIVEQAITQLARCVVDLWPSLWGGEDFGRARDDALTRAHLPIRLAGVARRVPGVSPAWAVAAVSNLLLGLPPLVAHAPPALEWAQLVLAFSPAGLTLTAPCGHDAVNEAWVRAIEWLARHGDVAAVALADGDAGAPALQRIAYEARRVAGLTMHGPVPARDRDPLYAGDGRPAILSLPVVEGAPHPQSAIEMRIWRLVQADEELRPILEFNRTVPDVALIEARADLLWLEGRVAVEIDGPEHRRLANYRRDRHRDYKLTCAGYRVLRVTNEEVAEDAALVVEKIRDVVRLAGKDAR